MGKECASKPKRVADRWDKIRRVKVGSLGKERRLDGLMG
jgi:hypothetical protein